MAKLLWRRTNQATLDSLHGLSRGQYDIRLTRSDEFSDFFSDLPRSGITEHGGYTLVVPLAAVHAPIEVPAQPLRVRYMGSGSRRRDWYIPSQRPDTAYPLWRPDIVGRGHEVALDTDYVLLIRDDDGVFHARWGAPETVAAMPVTVQRRLEARDVGVTELSRDEFNGVATALAVPVDASSSTDEERRDEILLALARFRESEALVGEELDDLVDEVGRVEATAAAGSGIAARVPEYLADFAALDAGAQAANPEAADAWREFGGDEDRLRVLAEAIRANLDVETTSLVSEDPEIESAPEGRILTSAHLRRERSRKLRQAKVQAAGEQPVCEVCGFDFRVTYGERGSGFIECHHLKPLHELRPGDATHLDDLALLCANCHRMIHASKPWLTIEALRELVESDR